MNGTVEKILSKESGIRLDLGCGHRKNKGFVGIDIRELPGVDVIHDLQKFPYPLPDECCVVITGSHIVEHINPANGIFFRMMDELWRIAQPDCQLAFSHPYGVNELFVQDPTHCNPCNQATWQYFDPRFPLYDVYKPKPWFIETGFPVWNSEGNMEVLFHKIGLQEAELLFAETKKKYGVGNGQ